MLCMGHKCHLCRSGIVDFSLVSVAFSMRHYFKIVNFFEDLPRKGLWTKKVPTKVKKTHEKHQGYWDAVNMYLVG